MELNDIDDILDGLGMGNPSPHSSPTPLTPSQQEDTDSTFSNEDIDDILQENGFSEEPENDGEGREEEEENTAYLERLNAENNTIDSQQSLEEATQIFETTLNDNATDWNDEEESNSDNEEESNEEEETEASEAHRAEVKIPLNSPTLLIDDSTTRFSGAEWFSEIQKQRIIVGGCGGIGSNLVFQLARMVPANITVYDDDNVEMVNMAGQLFSYSDIGKAKVDAIANMVSNYTSIRQIHAIKQRFTAITNTGDIMMSGFDNMTARRVFFDAWWDHIDQYNSPEEKAKCLLLDGRLSMDTLQIFCIRGDDAYNINRYRSEFLFRDNQADETVCSMKQTTYLACMIGSLMVNLFTNFVANQLNPIIPYDLPFFTEYDAQNMLFKTES